MKVNVGLFTLAICSLLSTGAAMARHHSHHAHGAKVDQVHASHSASNTAAKGDSHGTESHSGPADHLSATKDGSPKSGAGEARGDEAKGLHDRKAATNDVSIDTRITVHQGRAIAKSVRERLFGKPKGGLTVTAGRNSQRTAQSKTAPRRNAIGAVVADDKHHKHDKAAPAPTPPAASTVSPPAGVTSPSTGKADPSPKTIAAVPPVAANPGPPPPGGHSAANVAIVAVSKSGQSINGTGFSRTGSGTAVLGGSPKIVAGVISGNSVHLKHP